MKTSSDKDKLVVIWSSGERDVALKMLFVYLRNAIEKKWWSHITLVVWGPSAKLLSEDGLVRNFMKKNMDLGVETLACRSCTDEYEITEELEGLGLKVEYIGDLITQYMKSDRKLITF
jgi:hypothetical protein